MSRPGIDALVLAAIGGVPMAWLAAGGGPDAVVWLALLMMLLCLPQLGHVPLAMAAVGVAATSVVATNYLTGGSVFSGGGRVFTLALAAAAACATPPHWRPAASVTACGTLVLSTAASSVMPATFTPTHVVLATQGVLLCQCVAGLATRWSRRSH